MSFVGIVRAGEIDSPVASAIYGTCATAAGTAQKEVTMPDIDTVFTGLTIFVKFMNSNTAASPTLKVAGLSAYPIYKAGVQHPGTTPEMSWIAGSILPLTFDGQAWIIAGWLNTNTTYNDATPSARGLMAAADKTKLDTVSFQDSLIFRDVSVPLSAWVSDSTYTGYPYKAVITCTGVTADYFPQVAFSQPQITEYFPASVAETGAGTVTVWVRKKPTAAITIPTILCVRQAASV